MDARPLAEESRILSADRFTRWGLLRRSGVWRGTIAWPSRGGAAECEVWYPGPGEGDGSGALAVVRYGIRGPPHACWVPLVSVMTHWGARRWFFLCPGCDRRCGRLYLPPSSNHFRCRRCHRITYETCRLPRLSERFIEEMSRLFGAEGCPRHRKVRR